MNTNKIKKLLLMLAGTPEEQQRLKNNTIIIIGSLVLANVLISQAIPWMWRILFFSGLSLVVFNLGIFIVALLNTLEGPDKKPHPTAQKAAKWLGAILAVAFLTTAYTVVDRGDLTAKEFKERKNFERMLSKAPKELRAVAMCETDLFETQEKFQKMVKMYHEVGLIAWHGSAQCWAPKIGREFSYKLEVDSETFNGGVTIPVNWTYNISTKEAIEYLNERGEKRSFDPAAKVRVHLNAEKLWVRKRDPGKMEVGIMFFPPKGAR